MKKKLMLIALSLLGGALVVGGCMDRKPAPVCPVPTEIQSTEPRLDSFDGVDLLVVVDNSISMEEEQEILATSFFPLINSLVNPLPDWPYPPTSNIRIALTTSDMGLSWGGNAFDPVNDGWPGGISRDKCEDPRGDNGGFILEYSAASSGLVNIQEGVIACDNTAIQCPPGWDCDNLDGDGKGVCVDPAGDGTGLICPLSPAARTAPYLSLDNGWDNSNLAFTTACLANVGTEGCGFEQQLIAAHAAMVGPGVTSGFMRQNSLTAVLVVSDEEDCSMKNGPGIFGSDEVQIGEKINIACGENAQHLYTAAEIKRMYDEAKGRPNAVLFAAITGVPYDENPAVKTACEGTGSDLGGCSDMELPNDGGTMGNPNTWVRDGTAVFYALACERFEGDNRVTDAFPAMRYVDLAQEFGSMSYIYSICNRDWSPAMEDIATLIAQSMTGTCYSKRLGWNPAEKTAACNAVLEFSDGCPDGYDWSGEEEVPVDKGEDPVWACTLPKIPLDITCSDTADTELRRIEQEEFGWYYCENGGRENFSDACSDRVDNDGDGLVDCDDPGCAHCANCTESGVGDPDLCPNLCRFMVTFTESALDMSKLADRTAIQCLQEFRFEDPNCQENTYAACNDGIDNDGNGPYDCDRVTLDDKEANDGLKVHNPDPACCPMVGEPGEECNLDVNDDGVEDWTSNCDGTKRPAACVDAAAALQCQLPTSVNI